MSFPVLMDIIYEGGRANGFGGAVTLNCHTVFYGPRGKEHKYVRTQRVDKNGRTIFTFIGAVE